MQRFVSALSRRLTSSLALGLIAYAIALPASARADGSSIVTLGAGAGIGMHQESGGASTSAFVNQASVRLKLLYFFGLDYQFDLSHDVTLSRPSEDLQLRAKMRLTALLYPYSGESVAFYMGVGIGGTKLAELGRIDAPGNSYHGGIGFEIHVMEHLSIDLSFMMVVPGVASIERTTVAELEAAYARGGAMAMARYLPPQLDDFVSLKNHEIMLRVLLFL